jgi:plastocyanin
VLAVAAAVLAGCTNTQPVRFTQSASAAAVTASAGPNGTERVTVEANDRDRFVPDRVVAHPGTITLVIRNVGGVPHNFEIPSLGADSGNIAGHTIKSVTVTVSKPGTYRFDCAYHVTLHMDGVLEVVSR